MPVYQDKATKKWRVSYRIKDPVTGQWCQKTKRGFPTKREAKIAEAELMQETTTGGKTFHQISDEYNRYMSYSPELARKHEVRFEKSFSEYYDVPIQQITVAQLIDFQNRLNESKYATKTKRDTIQFVKAVFRYANTVYNIQNISSVLKSPKKTAQEKMKEMDIWTVEQFEQFIQYVQESYFKLFFTVLFWTGMRRGECIALQQSDLQGDELSITKSMKHFKNGFLPTKTGKSRRVKIDSQTLAALQPLLDQPGPFLFGGDRSLSISMIQRRFSEAVEASGVKPIRIHDLRHSHASMLINNGVNILAVSKRLGHANVSITLNVYSHLMEQTDNDMMVKIDEIHQKCCQNVVSQ